MLHGTPSIRTALPTDRDAVLATVAAAFDGDPGWAFLLAGGHGRLAPEFAGALFDTRIASRSVWVTGDLSGVAMWDPPRVAATADVEAIWERYRAVAGAGVFERLARYQEALAAVAPTEPHWYLGVLATRPESQRRGLASALMAPTIEDADSHGLACCLETSTPENRGFYERRGFTDATRLDVKGAPPTWWMRRPAAPKQRTAKPEELT